MSVDEAATTERRFVLTYSGPMIRRAVRRFVLRSLGWSYYLALACVVAALAWAILDGDRSWWVGAAGLGLALGIAMPLFAISAHSRGKLAAFQRSASPNGELRVRADGFSVHTELGHVELPWQALERVWRYDDAWLLVVAPNQFFTVPTESLSADDRQQLLDRMRSAGVAVA